MKASSTRRIVSTAPNLQQISKTDPVLRATLNKVLIVQTGYRLITTDSNEIVEDIPKDNHETKSSRTP